QCRLCALWVEADLDARLSVLPRVNDFLEERHIDSTIIRLCIRAFEDHLLKQPPAPAQLVSLYRFHSTRRRPTDECVAWLRRLADDDTLGRSSRTILVGWGVGLARSTVPGPPASSAGPSGCRITHST